MLERGATPLMGPEELKELGFDLVVWPLAPLYSVAKSLTDVYTTLRRDGSTLAILDRLMPFDEFNGIVGLNEKYALDAKFKNLVLPGNCSNSLLDYTYNRIGIST